MNILLDTHVALWLITDSPRLSTDIRKLALSDANTLWISAVNIWEIAIKHRIKPEIMPISGRQAMGYFQQAGYAWLPVKPEHAVATETLPMHHQDPFDRLLIAQALVEPMQLMTHDTKVLHYSDHFIQV